MELHDTVSEIKRDCSTEIDRPRLKLLFNNETVDDILVTGSEDDDEVSVRDFIFRTKHNEKPDEIRVEFAKGVVVLHVWSRGQRMERLFISPVRYDMIRVIDSHRTEEV